jgi:hypothetical protein
MDNQSEQYLLSTWTLPTRWGDLAVECDDMQRICNQTSDLDDMTQNAFYIDIYLKSLNNPSLYDTATVLPLIVEYAKSLKNTRTEEDVVQAVIQSIRTIRADKTTPLLTPFLLRHSWGLLGQNIATPIKDLQS